MWGERITETANDENKTFFFTDHQAYRRNRTELNSRARNFTGYPRGVSVLSVIRQRLFQLEPTVVHLEMTFCGKYVKNKEWMLLFYWHYTGFMCVDDDER